jgi:hypothetical protein
MLLLVVLFGLLAFVWAAAAALFWLHCSHTQSVNEWTALDDGDDDDDALLAG